MPKWTDYTIKTEPADNDEVMILDTAGKANKRLGLSALSEWILNKLAVKVFQKLKTNSKTVLGAINELNSKNPFLVTGGIDTTTDLNTLIYSGLQPKIYGKACPNSPGIGCFILNLKTDGNGAAGVTQIAIGYINSSLYLRNSDLRQWSQWSKIL